VTNTYRIEAVVLKRSNYGEADRIVTLFSREVGKLVVVAKGVRKITSKRLGSLEPGTLLSALVIKGKGMDILSGTVIINSFAATKKDLVAITQLSQLLEVIDLLTRENQELPDVYQVLVNTLTSLTQTTNRKQMLLAAFHQIASLLGFAPPEDLSETALKNYIESIAERHLHSKEYLMPGRIKT
jgi:DNA repair protein RecO (recombination protein O)